MRVFIYIVMILVLSFSPLIGFGENNNFEFPQEIHELENVMIIVHKKTKFKIIISNKCLQIFQLNGVTFKNGYYHASENNSYIELGNKCFQGDNVTIRISTDSNSFEKQYKILPQEEEEQDWGC